MDDTHDRHLVPDGGGQRNDEFESNDTDINRTAVVKKLYDPIPFHQSLDMEVLVVSSRHAELMVPFGESLVGNPDLRVIHGGIICSLADVTGAAVFVGECQGYTPTVDLRLNYLKAAGERPLYATATVERRGKNIGVASIEVESGDTICATGTGVYKLTDG